MWLENSLQGFKRIVGGVESEEGQWPWMVRLSAKASGESVTCGGAILSSHFILTAAQCFSKAKLF